MSKKKGIMKKMPEEDRVELSKKKMMHFGRPKVPDKTENQRQLAEPGLHGK